MENQVAPIIVAALLLAEGRKGLTRKARGDEVGGPAVGSRTMRNVATEVDAGEIRLEEAAGRGRDLPSLMRLEGDQVPGSNGRHIDAGKIGN